MKTQASRRLDALSAEITAARAELDRVRDRLEVQRALLDESRLKMLIAETPLADRQLQAAASTYLPLEREAARLENGLLSLRGEERLLAEQLAGV